MSDTSGFIIPADLVANLERRLSKRTTYVPECGCHLWTGALSRGHGVITIPRLGRTIGAHRIAYALKYGEVPPGLDLDHLCRVPSCVNPDHLEAVTRKENVLRGVGVTAMYAKRTHCANGHPLGGSNAVPNDARSCLTCKRARDRANAAAKGRMLKAGGR